MTCSSVQARSIIFQNSKAAMRSLTGELKDNPMHKQVVDATMLYGSMLLPAYMKVHPCDTFAHNFSLQSVVPCSYSMYCACTNTIHLYIHLLPYVYCTVSRM